jgi:hypothetical protein
MKSFRIKKIPNNFFHSGVFYTFEKIRKAILGRAPDWSRKSGLHGVLKFFISSRPLASLKIVPNQTGL